MVGEYSCMGDRMVGLMFLYANIGGKSCVARLKMIKPPPANRLRVPPRGSSWGGGRRGIQALSYARFLMSFMSSSSKFLR